MVKLATEIVRHDIPPDASLRSIVAKDTVFSRDEAREWDRRVGDGCRVRLWTKSLKDVHIQGRHGVPVAAERPRIFSLCVRDNAHSTGPVFVGFLCV